MIFSQIMLKAEQNCIIFDIFIELTATTCLAGVVFMTASQAMLEVAATSGVVGIHEGRTRRTAFVLVTSDVGFATGCIMIPPV